MKSETVFKVIAELKQEFIDWDELPKPCDAAVRKAMIESLEFLESKLREQTMKDSPIVCECGCLIPDVETWNKHKMICTVANK